MREARTHTLAIREGSYDSPSERDACGHKGSFWGRYLVFAMVLEPYI